MDIRSFQAHVAELLSRLEAVRDTESGWTARCPSHEDNQNSLSIGIGSDNRILLKCFAGCSAAQVAEAVGLQLRDLFPPREDRSSTALRRTPPPNKPGKPPEAPPEPATVAGLAARKRLPADFLRDQFHLRDLPGGRGVALPYLDRDGSLLFERTRAALTAKAGTYQPKGTRLRPYALWLPRRDDYLILCEGESDCWTLTRHGFPALGIPGASAAKCLTADHLEGISRVYLWRESDSAGTKFVDSLFQHLQAIGFAGEIRLLCHPQHKDPSDLHIADPDGFPTALKALLESAPLIEDREAKPHLPTPDPLQPGVGGKVAIELTHDNAAVTAQVTTVLARDGELFNRAGTLVRPVCIEPDTTQYLGRTKPITRPAGTILLRPADTSYVNLRISERCILVDGRDRYCNPPAWLASSVLTMPGPIRQIAGLLPAPTVDHTGRLIAKPGYDEATRLYLATSGDNLELPDNPSREDAIAAAARLLDLVGQFPFETDYDRSRWLALVLTLAVRHMVDCSPLFLVSANAAGAGKTTLANMASAIVHGKYDPITMSWPESSQSREDGLRKRLASLLHESATYVVLDNLPRGADFSSAALDAFVTSLSYTDRELKRNDGARVGGPNRCVICATGNSVAAVGDTADRTLTIRLVCDHPNPRSRPLNGFAIPDIVGHVLSHRNKYLADTLTIWRAWLGAGHPQPNGPSWGSFASWNNSVGAVIRWLELPDPVADRQEIIRESDRESQSLAYLLSHWAGVIGNDPVMAGELILRLGGESTTVSREIEAMREALLNLTGNARPLWPISAVRLGKLLTSYNRAVCVSDSGDARLQLVSEVSGHAKQKKFRVIRTSLSGAGDAGDAGDNSPYLTRDAFSESSTFTNHAYAAHSETSPASPASPASDTVVLNGHAKEVYHL